MGRVGLGWGAGAGAGASAGAVRAGGSALAGCSARTGSSSASCRSSSGETPTAIAAPPPPSGLAPTGSVRGAGGGHPKTDTVTPEPSPNQTIPGAPAPPWGYSRGGETPPPPQRCHPPPWHPKIDPAAPKRRPGPPAPRVRPPTSVMSPPHVPRDASATSPRAPSCPASPPRSPVPAPPPRVPASPLTGDVEQFGEEARPEGAGLGAEAVGHGQGPGVEAGVALPRRRVRRPAPLPLRRLVGVPAATASAWPRHPLVPSHPAPPRPVPSLHPGRLIFVQPRRPPAIAPPARLRRCVSIQPPTTQPFRISVDLPSPSAHPPPPPHLHRRVFIPPPAQPFSRPPTQTSLQPSAPSVPSTLQPHLHPSVRACLRPSLRPPNPSVGHLQAHRRPPSIHPTLQHLRRQILIPPSIRPPTHAFDQPSAEGCFLRPSARPFDHLRRRSFIHLPGHPTLQL